MSFATVQLTPFLRQAGLFFSFFFSLSRPHKLIHCTAAGAEARAARKVRSSPEIKHFTPWFLLPGEKWIGTCWVDSGRGRHLWSGLGNGAVYRILMPNLCHLS